MPRCRIEYSEAELKWLFSNRALSLREYHQQFVAKFDREGVLIYNLRDLRARKGWLIERTGPFKKGQTPHNKDPVGTKTTVQKSGYRKIKVAEPNQWKLLHRFVWEQANGYIPKGYVVVFRDGNQSNCDLSNLRCVHRGVLIRMNHYTRKKVHPDLRDTVLTVCELDKTIRDSQKES